MVLQKCSKYLDFFEGIFGPENNGVLSFLGEKKTMAFVVVKFSKS